MNDQQEILMGLISRLSVLEDRQEALARAHEESLKRQKEENMKLDSFMERFNRYEARWGGILMVLSALGAMFALFKTEVLRHLGVSQ